MRQRFTRFLHALLEKEYTPPIISANLSRPGSKKLSISQLCTRERERGGKKLVFEKRFPSFSHVEIRSSVSEYPLSPRLDSRIGARFHAMRIVERHRIRKVVGVWSARGEKRNGLKRMAGGREADPRGCIPAERRTGVCSLSLSLSLFLLLRSLVHARVMKLFLHRAPVSCTHTCTHARMHACIRAPRRFYCSRARDARRAGLGPRKRGEARNAGNWISSLSGAQQYPWRYCCRAELLHFASAREWRA